MLGSPRRRLIAAAAIVTLAVAAPAAAKPQRWTARMMGNEAGFLTVEREAGGAIRSHFEYNDRGRGPKVDSRLVLGPDGTPASLAVDGNEYYKGPVAERFSREGGKASWKNRGEQGESTASGPAFYSSYDGTPNEIGYLVMAAAKAPGQRIALLPSGTASVRKLPEVELAAGGKKRRVVPWEVVGLGLEPFFVWLEPDGSWFGSPGTWFSLLPAGWEGANDQLVEVEKKAGDERRLALAKSLAKHPAAGIAFTGAGLFDAEARIVRPGMTLLVVGDRIAAVGQDGTVAIPAGAEVVDARGKTLIPGLWDMHQHFGDLDGLLDIAAGVTTGRDLANDTDTMLARKRSWDSGETIGPRVLLAGFIDGPGPYAGPSKVLVSTPEEAIKAVDKYAGLGYVQVKMYSSLDPKLVPVIAKRAHEHGMRVSGHVPATMIAEQAIADGYDEVQHVNMLLLDLWPEVTETRTPARFTEVAERAADVDLASPAVRKLVDLMRQRDIVSDPTLATFEDLYLSRAGSVGPTWSAIAERLPPTVRRGFLAGGLPVPEGKDERYRASWKKCIELVGVLHRAGVRIVAGTDAFAGFALHRELELYVDAGIPAADVLRIATLGAAEVMGKDGELGSLQPGKLADLALVPGDPTRDIGAL
ncbi:MAG TPA: amidohydrolase family protein, partial [Thermoanaerobaculia bacterium]|nr:amidohydrolase family protein [Thermoanaerobaculia bacterium]